MENENKKAVKILSLSHFIIDNYSAFVTPLLPLIVMKLNTTLGVITGIISISHICSSLFQPIFGHLADKWKKRFFVFWGMIIASTFFSMIGIANNIFILGLCLILGSLGVGLFHPQATGLTGYYSGNNLTKNMGVFLACGTFGYALGPIISSGITDFLGLKYLPWMMCIGITCALLVLKYVPKTSHLINDTNKLHFKTAIKEIFKDIPLRVLFMISVLKSFITSPFSIFPPFLWTKMGYTTFEIGVLIFIYLMFSGFGTFSSRFFEKRIGAKNTFRLSLMSTFPLTILYFLTYKNFPILSFVFYFLIGYFTLLSVSVNMVMAQKRKPEYKNIISGFIGGFSWGVVGVLLAFLGFLAQKFGVQTLLLTISLIPLLCTYFLKYLPEEKN